MDNGWACDGRNLAGGCKRGITGFNQTKGVPRFRCTDCDYDLCDKCIGTFHHPCHPHPLTKNDVHNGWACDGRKLLGGCKRGITGWHQTAGVPRYRCDTCDFDLCDKCIESVHHPCHPHSLKRNNMDNGWACDGRNLPGGCKRGITGFNQTKGVPRFRCTDCDFDLCDKCTECTEYDCQFHPHPLLRSCENTVWRCDGRNSVECKQGNETGVPRFRCDACDFDLCDKCVKSVLHPCHSHPLKRNRNDNGWACDGRNLTGGCKRGITGFNQTKGVPRFRCEQCDYDMCDKCIGTFHHPSHPHPLTKNPVDYGWACEGRKPLGGCLRGITGDIQTAGIPRYSCSSCNFDLCDKCIESVVHPSHAHPLKRNNMDHDWTCAGRNLPGGCKRRGLTKGIHRFSCDQCKFDLCDRCVTLEEITHPSHPHVLTRSNDKGRWFCDGRGCKSPSFRGVARYRCNLCDYDLCDGCIQQVGRKLGTGTGACLYYCGRFVGTKALPGSDGYCGPINGPQCRDCIQYQQEHPVPQPGSGIYSHLYYCGEEIGADGGYCGPSGGPQCEKCIQYQREHPVHQAVVQKLGSGRFSHLYYCGRHFGVSALPGSDGFCGPEDGPQCEDCIQYQREHPVQQAVVRKLGSGRFSHLYYCGRHIGMRCLPGSVGFCGPNAGPQCKECIEYQRQNPVQPVVSTVLETTVSSPSSQSVPETSGSSPLSQTRASTTVECKICYVSQVDSVFIPCGHTICMTCSTNLKVCHICRQKVLSIHRIFFS
eukprot:TRINITY_DN8381_c0_g1_i14.p1 TRINITY_DN8381_c0_g1~~TRINITY_DN8381_c0_g1_i14.p1  ORF type:complete len:761 (-),score=90.56 TRINITY_DN8381_c0_g1_i14:158-2440(-)